MEKCFDCGKKAKCTEKSDNGAKPEMYCDECSGFPQHEYSTTCPNCDLEILVN